MTDGNALALLVVSLHQGNRLPLCKSYEYFCVETRLRILYKKEAVKDSPNVGESLHRYTDNASESVYEKRDVLAT